MDKIYTNFGIENLANTIYYNARYFGRVRTNENEICEFYLAFKENTCVYLILSFDEETGEIKIKNEIERNPESSKMMDDITCNIIMNNSFSYDEGILELKKVNKRG